ncbi:MAG: hypothetical protein OXF02_06340 [Simkaniaceae bacterium]|nr:hypothetical protein [Simkaniaceae bacterium]
MKILGEEIGDLEVKEYTEALRKWAKKKDSVLIGSFCIEQERGTTFFKKLRERYPSFNTAWEVAMARLNERHYAVLARERLTQYQARLHEKHMGLYDTYTAELDLPDESDKIKKTEVVPFETLEAYVSEHASGDEVKKAQ